MRFYILLLILILDYNSMFSQSGVNYNLSDISITCVTFDKDKIWIGTKKGIFYGDLEGNIFNANITLDTIPDVFVTCSMIDKFNNKWFGTKGNGVILFDNSKWHVYDKEVRDIYINSITSDSVGNIWVATNFGISKYSNGNWNTYTTADGLIDNAVTSLAIDSKNCIWASTTFGISVYQNNKWISYSNKDIGMSMNFKKIYIDSKDCKWLITYDGQLISFDENLWENYSNGLTSPFFGEKVKCLFIDNEYIWTCSEKGYLKISKKNESISFLFSFELSSISFDNSNKPLIATDLNGLISLDVLDYQSMFNLNKEFMNRPVPIFFDRNGLSSRLKRDDKGHFIFSGYIFRSKYYK